VAHWDVLEKSNLLSQLRIDRGAYRAPRRRTRLYVVLAAAVLLLGGRALVGCSPGPAPVVQTAVAARQPGGRSPARLLDASGYVTARRQATSPQDHGKVTEVLIEEGQRVREGAVLARLDDTEAQAQIRAHAGPARRRALTARRGPRPARPGRAGLHAPEGAPEPQLIAPQALMRRSPSGTCCAAARGHEEQVKVATSRRRSPRCSSTTR